MLVRKGVMYVDENVGFFCYNYAEGMDGNLYMTKDGGKTFSKVTLPDQELDSTAKSSTASSTVADDELRWTVILYADNGWNFMEGELIGHNPPSLAASASYHMGDFDFTLYMHNPFMAHPKSYSAEIVNALLRKQVRGYDNSGGNLFRIVFSSLP